jgi:hypothetical protein
MSLQQQQQAANDDELKELKLKMAKMEVYGPIVSSKFFIFFPYKSIFFPGKLSNA